MPVTRRRYSSGSAGVGRPAERTSVFRKVHRQHRHGRTMQHLPGRRSEQREIDCVPPVDTEDDQIGLGSRRDACLPYLPGNRSKDDYKIEPTKECLSRKRQYTS